VDVKVHKHVSISLVCTPEDVSYIQKALHSRESNLRTFINGASHPCDPDRLLEAEKLRAIANKIGKAREDSQV